MRHWGRCVHALAKGLDSLWAQPCRCCRCRCCCVQNVCAPGSKFNPSPNDPNQVIRSFHVLASYWCITAPIGPSHAHLCALPTSACCALTYAHSAQVTWNTQPCLFDNNHTFFVSFVAVHDLFCGVQGLCISSSTGQTVPPVNLFNPGSTLFLTLNVGGPRVCACAWGSCVCVHGV